MSALALVAGDAHPQLAGELARQSGLPLVTPVISRFADGETHVRIDEDVRECRLFIVQPTSTPVNERLMTLALIADAARNAGAAHITALMPYFGYARQDVRRSAGEPRSARLAARILAAAGVGGAIALELHSAALESAFDMPLMQLRADELFLPLLRGREFTIVSPDAGGMKRAQRYAAALDAPLAVLAKKRGGQDAAAPLQLLGEVRGRTCCIVDDLASTGRTIAGAAQALQRAGAAEVHALFVHAVMASGALARMRGAGINSVTTTDSVGPVSAADVRVVPCAPILAAALPAGPGPR